MSLLGIVLIIDDVRKGPRTVLKLPVENDIAQRHPRDRTREENLLARLFRPKSAVCDREFKLRIDGVWFIGYPCSIGKNDILGLQEYQGHGPSDGSGKEEEGETKGGEEEEARKKDVSGQDVSMFNIVFVVDTSAFHGGTAGQPESETLLAAYANASRVLANALLFEEGRSRYLSHQIKAIQDINDHFNHAVQYKLESSVKGAAAAPPSGNVSVKSAPPTTFNSSTPLAVVGHTPTLSGTSIPEVSETASVATPTSVRSQEPAEALTITAAAAGGGAGAGAGGDADSVGASVVSESRIRIPGDANSDTATYSPMSAPAKMEEEKPRMFPAEAASGEFTGSDGQSVATATTLTDVDSFSLPQSSATLDTSSVATLALPRSTTSGLGSGTAAIERDLTFSSEHTTADHLLKRLLQHSTLAYTFLQVYTYLSRMGVAQVKVNGQVSISLSLHLPPQLLPGCSQQCTPPLSPYARSFIPAPVRVPERIVPHMPYSASPSYSEVWGTAPIRPYQTLLLLQPPDEILGSLPTDPSPQLRILLRAADPCMSFHQLQVATGIPFESLAVLSAHLSFWGRARIIDTITLSSIYKVSPDAPELLHAIEADFRQRFPMIESLSEVLALFWPPRRLQEILKQSESGLDIKKPTFGRKVARYSAYNPLNTAASLPEPDRQSHEQLVLEMLVWLLTKRCIMQLHPFFFLLCPSTHNPLRGPASSPRPGHGGNGAPSDDLPPISIPLSDQERDHILSVCERVRSPAGVKDLALSLAPYFRGMAHMEEIMWRENVAEKEFYAVLYALGTSVISTVY